MTCDDRAVEGSLTAHVLELAHREFGNGPVSLQIAN